MGRPSWHRPGLDRDGHEVIPLLNLVTELGWAPERAVAAVDVLCGLVGDRADPRLCDPAELVMIDGCVAS